MGEMADYLINGEDCEICGSTFFDAHGYPVICKDCWKTLRKAERKNRQQAIYDTIN